MQSAQPDRAFEVFVKRTLSAIQKESWGRSKECKELREMCQNVLNLLHDHEQGHLQYEGSLAVAVLEPLYLACASSNPKVLEAALGCLHKLVAHAWLQGESSSGGQVNDADVVSRVIRTVIRCGETNAVEDMQLAVIRALLTFTTAEHFVAHGDCLLAAVRMVFNLALGAEDDIIKRTASNALLQMLNTITKRVTAYQLYGSSSAATSRRSSLDGSLAHSHSQLTPPPGGPAGGASTIEVKGTTERAQLHKSGRGLVEEQQATEAALAAAAAAAAARWVASGGSKADSARLTDSTGVGDVLLPPVSQPSLSNTPSGMLSPSDGGLQMTPSAGGTVLVGRFPQQDGDGDGTPARDSNRTAQLAILAEQRDLVGLEAALMPIAGLDEGLNASEEEGPVVGRLRHPVRCSEDGVGPSDAARGADDVDSSSSSSNASGHSTGPTYSLRTTSLALPHGYVPPSPPPPLPPIQPSAGRSSASGAPPLSLALSSPVGVGGSALESPLMSDAATGTPLPTAPDSSSLPTRTSQQSQRRLGQQLSLVSSSHQSGHHHHHHHSRHHHNSGGAHRSHGPRPLRTPERDVLLVMTAFCRLASREGGVTEVDKYLAAGKLLALELVVKVLQNPIHCWDNVRDEFVRHLHRPLCLMLLRNCSPSEATAFQLALKLLTALLLQPKLRKGLKAELGAFYPLLLLRPLEVEQIGVTELAPVASAVPCLAGLCSEPQLLVDLFVNYDCDLKAPNLYERTVQALSKLSQRTELDGPPPPAGPKQQELARQLASVRDTALRCLLSVVNCLDVWSAPLKEQGPEGAEKPGGAGGRGAATGQQDETRESESESGAGSLATVSAGTGTGLRANGSTTAAGTGASEAERFEAVKVTKSSLTRGLSMFNGGNPVKAMRFLISSGLVEDSPAGVAVFLRAHASDLDPTAMGEYLGHHEDLELAAMHAYVDQERFGGMSIDAALRSFLMPFRLPGEAQKIDRLMEAFAERYVHDNAGVFRNADAAYVLAFAVIMLNTDAHNPLAERRLDRAGFVAMTSLPTEDGGGGVYEPALPVRELEGIYDRIVAKEIVVRSAPAGGAGRGSAGGTTGGKRGGGGRGGAGNKLAAALGLRALVAPFRSANGVDRKQVSNAERQRQQMMELAELAVARGGDSGSTGPCLSATWHSCTHAAHTRPMLTVSGETLTAALVAVLPHVPDAQAVLRALVTLAELAGLMGLEEMCEAAVAAVAAAASVAAPAPFGTAAAARQLAALRALLGAVANPEAGQLGSAWTIILRTASELEALVRVVTRPQQPGETGVAFMSPPSAAAGGGGGTVIGEPGAATSSAGGTSLLTKVFGGLWGAGGSLAGGGSGGARATSNGSAGRGGRGGGGSAAASAAHHKDNARLPPPPVRVMPGSAMVMWAVTDGRQVIEQVYTRSASLDGEAVVVFVRALCAVSREELDAQRPRVYSLQRLVEVAHLNLAGRIRLIWSKLWAVLSAHLVMAACHSQQPIAAQAVDALRSLAGRVLEREQLQLQRANAGVASRGGASTTGGVACGGSSGLAAVAPQALTQSTWGSSEGALRPFVAVLRLSDDPSIRAMALATVAGIMTSHARGLGAGWRVAMEALRRASEDVSQAVYEQALGALEVAVAALFRAATAAAPALRHSSAVPLTAACGEATAANAAAASAPPPPPGHDCYRETLRAVLTAIRNPHHLDRAPQAVQLLVQVGERLVAQPTPLLKQTGGSGGVPSSGFPSSHASLQQLQSQSSAPQQPLESPANGAANSSLSSPAYRSLLDRLAALPQHSRPTTPAEDWALLMEVVAEVAATPSAPRLAAAGLEASLDLMRRHSAAWGVRAWRVMLHRVVAAVAFRVPPALDPVAYPAEAAAAAAAGLPLESISASFVARVDRLFPLMCNQLVLLADAPMALARDTELHGRHRRWSYGSDDDDSDELRLGGCDGNGGRADLYRELLALLAETCLGWFRHPAEAVARVGLSSLSHLLEVTGGVVLPSPLPAEGSSTAPVSPGSSLQQQQQHLQRGWDVLIPRLSSTLGLELDLITQFAVRLRFQQQQQQQQAAALSAAAVTPRPLFTVPRPALDPEVRRLRCRCRMAVLLQRTLCEHTARRAEQLPWSVTHQLVVLLVGMVRRLMTFNMREDLPPEVLMEQQQQLLNLQGRRHVELQGNSEEGLGTGKDPAGADAAAAPVGEAAAAANGEGWGEGWDDGWDDGEVDSECLPAESGTRIEVGTSMGQGQGQGQGGEDGDATDNGILPNGGLAGVPSLKSPVRKGDDATELSSSDAAGQGGADKAAKLQPEDAAEVATAEGHETDETEAPTSTATVPATADAEAGAAAIAAAAPGPALPGARLKLSGPHLQLTSATSHDGMRPALARLEVEAADATITLLLSCAETASLSAAVERRREACVQLETFCRHIITCSVAAHTLAATTATSSSGVRHAASLDISQEPAALDPDLPGSSWDHAVRAPVLARAIRVLLMLDTSEGDKSAAAVGASGGAAPEHQQARQLALLPDVLTLLRSHQPVVRGAVADYLEVIVGPRLQRLLAQ
ncbi:hypothetical protein VaNZ11_013463 [Volvox africanus]|uniref:SEC7 domain-containing protein n=1 Tax=Volvox africanus TaxID=51714 RepID=A0ABQ5SG17_9CHLO|nr:hypothetical protein VaNZ11_013463 [Volvox africanus]